MNRMLLGENQLLRSKLKDTEKLNDTLRNENNMFSRLHNQSTQDTGHQSTDDLLAGFVAEMRELRLRLEDSIRTNDALRAQLEKRLLSEGGGEAEGTGVALIELFSFGKMTRCGLKFWKKIALMRSYGEPSRD